MTSPASPQHTRPLETLTVVRSLPTEALRLPFAADRRWVPYQSIVVCKSEGNYTRLYFRSGTTLLYSRTLGYILTLLPGDTFTRIHRSHAVNRSYIKVTTESKVVLNNGSAWTFAVCLRLTECFGQF